MAQPLLRKTFSRLRGKERLGRKKAPPPPRKDPEPPPAAPEPSAEPELLGPLPPDAGCRKGANITVSRKQNWAKFTWGSQENSRNRKLCRNAPSTAPGPAGLDEGLFPESLPSVGLVVTSESPVSSLEGCSSSLSAKYSSQGAYLQSLERSSRHWVLSAGKSQGTEERAASPGAEPASVLGGTEGEIWYNPIPEDENLQLPCLERRWGSSAENRSKKGKPREVGAAGECARLGALQQAANDGLRTLPNQERPAQPAGELSSPQTLACGKTPVSSVDPEGAAPVAQSALAHKKGHSLGKAKSPGPVRSLSMKMKKLPELRRKLSLRGSRPRGPEPEGSSSPKESGNVISRYHLDSSVASRQPLVRGKVASKGGYLSDGDSPELLAKAEACLGLDGGSFRPYCFAEQPSCAQHLSGLVSIHLLGVQDFRPHKAEAKEAFCVLQVDSANKARTALLPCQAAFLDLNHSFQLELDHAQLLKVVVFSCDPTVGKNRVCCHGTIVLPHIFQGSRTQQVAMQLEPRGLLYIRLTLVDQWDPSSGDREPQVFGVNLSQLVERERAAVKVPLLIQKCVAQIEQRGLKVVGLYRLCGSAAVKKELRDAFERDSAAVALSEDLYPDINVITGILKDYLRELPTPLITDLLYQAVRGAMSSRPVGREAKESVATTALLDCLPEVEKATLTVLLDHLSLVAAFHTFNRMNAQNLAVCFGPVLLIQGAGVPGARSAGQRHHTIASTMDFKHHIEVLHYLLQAWPTPRRMKEEDRHSPPSGQAQHQCRPALDLPLLPAAVVARSRPRGLESPPSNRYAGDWSVCGQQFLAGPRLGSDMDYDEVAGSESDNEEGGGREAALREGLARHSRTVFVGDFALVGDPEAPPFSPRLNLKDFDALILDLERELSKQINVCL
ncbi:rho GTPase-activating protein SYDE1 [Elgaria multicarinata webbii]|uniref:rho GTPase-activating protein SYDE1 n=1 Tax=Elgaria multicarinata webbii TaxID=159646 RepID=UPI002FCD0A26